MQTRVQGIVERWGPALLAGCAMGIAVAITASLHGDPVGALRGERVIGAFHDSHVWCFDHIFRMITGDVPRSGSTDKLGWPEPVALPLVAWVPALLAAPLRIGLDALGAFNAALFLGPALTVLVTWLWLRRVFDVGVFGAAAGSVVYATCPYGLGCLASGQVEKVQLWCIPLVLWALDAVIRSPERRKALVLLPLSVFAAALTSPSSALVLPFAVVFQVSWSVWHTERSRRHALRGGLALALVALALVGTRGYYGDLSSSPTDGGVHQFGDQRMRSAFSPGTPPAEEALLEPSIVAQPQEMFLGRSTRRPDPTRAAHVTYLGLPLMLVFVGLAVRSWRGRALAVALVGAGIVLALGPRLAFSGEYVVFAGRAVVLPAAWLDAFGYPTSESGMYYRFAQLASLGLALGLASGVRALPLWARIGISLGVLVAQTWDGLRVTEDLWPRPVESFENAEIYVSWSEDPVPGAVIDLPLEADQRSGGVYMLGAALHGRATTALPRQSRPGELPQLARVDGWLREAVSLGDPAKGRDYLARRGVRYLVCHVRCRRPDGRYNALVRGLGEPLDAGGLSWWRLGSAPGSLDSED
jgi:hypothetical protein